MYAPELAPFWSAWAPAVPWLIGVTAVVLVLVCVGGWVLASGSEWWNMNRLRNDLERRRRLGREGRDASDTRNP